MARLTIDITQLADWQGKLTGIPRVMNELSLRFSQSTESRFVVWDKTKQVFQEVTYQSVVADRNTAPAVELAQSTGTAKRAARYAARKLPALNAARHTISHKIDSMLHPTTTTPTELETVQFEEGEILAVLWGAWDDQNYIQKLVATKQKGVKLVQVIYDMLPLVTPQYSGHATEALNAYASAVYPECSLLLAISEYSRKDVTKWLEEKKLTVPKIEVFRLGDDFSITQPAKPQDEIFTGSNLEGNDYILCVGTVEARKNHALLYYVYKLAQQRNISLPKLVVVGRRGWLSDDIFTLMTSDPETNKSILFLQNTSDEELSWLYDNCLFTVYPSFYEGWGLPIAESIAHGVPCVASNTSSMPEIAGDLITYFSPTSSDECLAAIQGLLDPSALAAAKEKISKYVPASWDDSFVSVNESIKSI